MNKPYQEKPESQTTQTLGVILSGGAGVRFEGKDKGLQIYYDKPLIQWVVDAITPQVDDVLICINRNRDDYESFSSLIVEDLDENYQGPVAGIVSAINYCSEPDNQTLYDQLLVSSCDTPLLATTFGGKLSGLLNSSNYLVAVVNDGKRNQNLHCLIKGEAWQSLIEFYVDGGRAMHRWYKTIGVLEVDFSESADCFLNINSVDQLT